MVRLGWNDRPMIPTTTIKSAPGATQDSLTKVIFEQREKMSKSLDRLEDSLQREGRWPRRRRRRGHVRCHRCQQPGHIARHCRAPAPIPAGRRQPSETASPALDIHTRDSTMPTSESRPRMHVWRYMTCPTKKFCDALFSSYQSRPRHTCRRVWPACMAWGQCIRTCAKTRRSIGNAGRAAMFMRLRFRFSNSLC